MRCLSMYLSLSYYKVLILNMYIYILANWKIYRQHFFKCFISSNFFLLSLILVKFNVKSFLLQYHRCFELHLLLTRLFSLYSSGGIMSLSSSSLIVVCPSPFHCWSHSQRFLFCLLLYISTLNYLLAFFISPHPYWGFSPFKF